MLSWGSAVVPWDSSICDVRELQGRLVDLLPNLIVSSRVEGDAVKLVVGEAKFNIRFRLLVVGVSWLVWLQSGVLVVIATVFMAG
ncbi:MAG: hypothetical protein DRN81_04355 [Thermoproteota archaeon]|nr:MAG: hypothetical protein DRN81_04355 [Candidatus Korarchaeota archaeon]